VSYALQQVLFDWEAQGGKMAVMPFVFVCHSCGAVLLEEQPTMKELNHARKPGYVERVAERLGGKCPVCGALLQTVPTK